MRSPSNASSREQTSVGHSFDTEHEDDGPVEGGEIATDPAKLVARCSSVPAGFSLACTWNPSRNIGSAGAP
jgi:hypothetical protein